MSSRQKSRRFPEPLPLYDEEDERAVLSAFVGGMAASMSLLGGLPDPALFAVPACKTILSAVTALYAKAAPIDATTVTQELREKGELENVGGPVVISTLGNRECTPVVAEYHLSRLRDLAILRACVEIAPWVVGAAKRGGATPDELIAGLKERTEQIISLHSSRKKGKLPEIEDVVAMLAEQPLTPLELVSGLLHQGAKMVIGGGSKSYKTWLLLDLGISVATGTDWLGFSTSGGRVLYINLEIQRGFLRSRCEEIQRAKGVLLKSGQLDIWNLRGHAANLSSLIADILPKCGQKYSLIILDPIYKVLGGRDENAAGDIGSLLNELDRLAVNSGAAVVFGAHFSKGNQAAKESIDRIGGSGVFARDPDTILVLTKHEAKEAFSVECTLRNHPPVESFAVRWNFPFLGRDASLDPAKLKQVGGRQKRHDANELLKVLGDAEMGYKDWLSATTKQTGMGVSTFKTLRQELMKSERVSFSEDAQTYQRAKKANKAN